jgi:RNA polymerase sigma-70 factor (ECF subfamily)
MMGVIDVLDRQHRESVSEDVPNAVADEHARLDRERAFHRLADRHLERSYRLATVVLESATEAQDAVHDAFVTAWRKYDTLRDPDRLEAWFDRIVVNTCRDRMRRNHRLQIRDISAGPDIAGSDPTAAVSDELVVEHALERLGPDDRIVLALRYYRDMKVDDIAAALDIRPRAATSRLHRAVERLRRILEHDEQEVAP